MTIAWQRGPAATRDGLNGVHARLCAVSTVMSGSMAGNRSLSMWISA
jgi:hypothetical protein